MFTGIVTAVGRITTVKRESRKDSLTVAGNGKARSPGLVLTIGAPYKALKRGESVAVNGACLTVERVVRGGFTAHAIATTLERTLLGEYAVGRRVNLERAMKASDRLGGAIVQGHVDGVGEIRKSVTRDDALILDLAVPDAVRAVTVLRGSITVDGVNLTVNALPGDGTVQVALIPFTRAHTTLGALQVGDRVQVEGDVLGKYVRALCHTKA